MLWNAILPGLLLLGLVIFVHELGHFLMAKWRKVRVLRFSMGFGPAMFKFTRGETEYRLAWIPLGGYVQMAGDSPSGDGEMPDRPDEFLSHPWYGRLMIAAAGPAANLVTAYIVLVIVWMVGVSYPDHPNRLGPTPDTSVAARMGLREGDAIVRVGEKPVASWMQIFLANSRAPETQPITIVVERAGGTFNVPLTPKQREPLFSSLRRPSEPPLVNKVLIGMPAYKAGLKGGDLILAVNGKPIATWDELPRALRGTVDQPVELKVRRGGQDFTVTVTPINPEGRDTQNAVIGIEPPRQRAYVEKYPLWPALEIGFRSTGAVLAQVYGGMWLTATRPLYYREYIGGPIFIAQMASDSASRGLSSFLQLLAMINIAIMAFNLLPLPILDGGHILLALIEGLRHQAISARSYLRFQKVGLVLMTALFVLILANDPLRLVQRQRALDKAPTSAPQERQVAPP